MIRTLLTAALTLGAATASTVVTATPAEPRTLTAPASPPVRVCGNHSILDGPATAPDGAVVVPAGNNAHLSLAPNTTYWFAPGVHTLGPGQYDQIIPDNGDVFVGAPGAILDGRHVNRYAFTQHATGVRIEHLTIRNFGKYRDDFNEGVVNHDAGHNWTIRYDTISHDAGAGVLMGSGDRVTYNCLSANGQYGFQSVEPQAVHGIVLSHNEIVGNNTDDWENQPGGCGCTGGGKFWDTDGADVIGNWVHGNHGPGLWPDTDNNDFLIQGNYIDHNDAEGVFYEISYNARIVANTFVHNAVVKGPATGGFPAGAVYLSESGGDARVPARWHTLTVSNNRFVDNWSGVVLWENADRFCGSDGNTSTGYCTLGNPSVANPSTCVAGTIDDQPYYDDCRWRTQNVTVAQNTFTFDPAHLTGCTTETSCGQQGLFSNYGTYPDWSPYQGYAVANAIAQHQHDVFRDNTYRGPWQFMVHEQGNVVSFKTWRGAPWHQDAGSTLQP